jgi:hypothetical protein
LVSIWFGLAWVLVWVWFQFGLPGLAWFGWPRNSCIVCLFLSSIYVLF